MLTKYATLEGAQVLDLKGSRDRVHTASLAKLGDFEDYRTDDGYLYARIRAISSRVNKNDDGWPSVELAGSPDIFDHHLASESGFTVEADTSKEYGYSTFLGKPVFVDHHNSDPDRARGVIVDAKLHVDDHKTAAKLDPYYASAPDNHVPPTWVELLLEVDARSFPKLAKAILDGSKDSSKGIDGFSMGCDVDRSVCNICQKEASSPDEYCTHIKLKGHKFDWINPKTGGTEQKKSYEDCYGIKFFEISAVFDPADETALLREVRSSVEKEGWMGLPFSPPPPDPDDSLNDASEAPVTAPPETLVECPHCHGFDPQCEVCHGQSQIKMPAVGNDGYLTPPTLSPSQVMPHGLSEERMGPVHQGRTAADSVADPCPACGSHTTEILSEDGKSHCHGCKKQFKTKELTHDEVDSRESARTADNPPPQSDLLHAPEAIDTLREEQICEVCGSSMDNEKCDVCGYVEPPEGMNNPDLTKAQDHQQGQQKPPDEAFEDLPEGALGPDQPGQPPAQPTSNPAPVAHVTSAWDISLPSRVAATYPDKETPVVPNKGPVTDEPAEQIIEDQTTPVTSSVRTARDFIAAAGATRRTQMNHTADAASGAPAVATPDTNVDTEGVGGVMDASNEQASKADAQINVEGQGGTGVESVESDETENVEQGNEHSKNIEQIPTKTFGDGSSAVERQADPVGSGVFKGGAWTVEALDDAPFPATEDSPGGGSAVQGTQPADPVGVAEDRVSVLDHVTSPANNSGPTDTWSGTDGNGVLRQQEPVTPESISQGESGMHNSHIFTAFQLADLEVGLGLLAAEKKYERVAALESVSPDSLRAQLYYAQRVKTAGLAKAGSRTAKRLPVLGRNASMESTPQVDDIPDEALFS